MGQLEKPPLGPLSLFACRDLRHRARELAAAIDRYEKAGRGLRVDWLGELEGILAFPGSLSLYVDSARFRPGNL